MNSKYGENNLIPATFDALFHDYYVKDKYKGDRSKIEALKNIYTFTSSKDYLNLQELNIKYNKKKDVYIYKKDNILVSFNKMYKYVEDEELYSEESHKNCHFLSYTLAKYFKEAFIVTGYAKLSSERKVSLHTFIVTRIKNKNIVLDGAYNLAMETSDYINLTDFRTLSSFTSEDILTDLRIIRHFPPISLKMYMVFRNELIEEIIKNDKIFPEKKELIDSICKKLIRKV